MKGSTAQAAVAARVLAITAATLRRRKLPALQNGNKRHEFKNMSSWLPSNADESGLFRKE
ncbi:MAG: hypothetical protein EOP02_01800 [Proteobacteria bacterium]|nr:MAG: hypothetical protein EOP02_01800 [Pseudomonadota bacterium]